ncbi:MAG: hypothetical protein HY367_04115 [Candidatus Aenigmarchaeota archaeon]|nr:hypothetical protein [Candidatus Aenigmarchaeota archaeon]
MAGKKDAANFLFAALIVLAVVTIINTASIYSVSQSVGPVASETGYATSKCKNICTYDPNPIIMNECCYGKYRQCITKCLDSDPTIQCVSRCDYAFDACKNALAWPEGGYCWDPLLGTGPNTPGGTGGGGGSGSNDRYADDIPLYQEFVDCTDPLVDCANEPLL